MLNSLRGRNVLLLAAMLLLGQLVTMLLVATMVISPQADRIATIIASNIRTLGATLDALPPAERNRFVARVNARGAYHLRPGVGEPPGADGRPTWLETRVLGRLASELGQQQTMVWRGGGKVRLWVHLRLGTAGPYWVALAPSQGWTPTGALAGSVAVALLLSLGAGLVLQRRINRPLAALADAVDAMPDARPVSRLAQDAPAEIASLASSFEGMAARLAAQEADRAFMLAAISHDLKTPIAKLRLATALRGDVEGQDEALIERQFHRIERMLDQFLDFGRGVQTEQPCLIDLRRAVSEVAASLDLAPASVAVPEGVVLSLRPLGFERAMANLLRNALVHGRPPISVHAVARLDGVDIVVTDEGPGVAPEQLPDLTRPFTRGSIARPSDGGVGLGLAIVQRFAEEAGGSLVIANRPERGLCAVLRLPRPAGVAVGSAHIAAP